VYCMHTYSSFPLSLRYISVIVCVDCYVSCKWLRVIWFSTSTFPVLLSPPIGGGDRSGDATAAKGTTPNQCVILQSVYWYCIYSFTMAIHCTHTRLPSDHTKGKRILFRPFFDMCGCHRSFSRAELVSHGNCIYIIQRQP
jgi:hypothetical protein